MRHSAYEPCTLFTQWGIPTADVRKGAQHEVWAAHYNQGVPVSALLAHSWKVICQLWGVERRGGEQHWCL
jgi:hypothetical protein